MGNCPCIFTSQDGKYRLPGKVLMPLSGQSILERAIRRLKAAPVVDSVVVLTTTLQEDDAIERAAMDLGVAVYRGSGSERTCSISGSV